MEVTVYKKTTLLFIENSFAAHDSIVSKAALGLRTEDSIHYGSDLALFGFILTNKKC
jgi:hypothetical protein